MWCEQIFMACHIESDTISPLVDGSTRAHRRISRVAWGEQSMYEVEFVRHTTHVPLPFAQYHLRQVLPTNSLVNAREMVALLSINSRCHWVPLEFASSSAFYATLTIFAVAATVTDSLTLFSRICEQHMRTKIKMPLYEKSRVIARRPQLLLSFILHANGFSGCRLSCDRCWFAQTFQSLCVSTFLSLLLLLDIFTFGVTFWLALLIVWIESAQRNKRVIKHTVMWGDLGQLKIKMFNYVYTGETVGSFGQ